MPSTLRPAEPELAGDPLSERLLRERDRLAELLQDQARGPLDEPTHSYLLAALFTVHEQLAVLRAGLGVEEAVARRSRMMG
jgi:hypothetical protein